MNDELKQEVDNVSSEIDDILEGIDFDDSTIEPTDIKVDEIEVEDGCGEIKNEIIKYEPFVTVSDKEKFISDVGKTLIRLSNAAPPSVKFIDAPDPGIYHDVDAENYHQWDALNASTIEWGMTSAEHMKAVIEKKLGKKDSAALNIGRAIHCKLLEPDKFDGTYITSGRCCGVYGKSAKKQGQCINNGMARYGDKWYCGTHAPDNATTPKNVLTPLEYADVLAIEKKVKMHDCVHMLRSEGGFESSAIWCWNGIKCKFRMDKFILANDVFGHTIIDVKKVRVGRATDKAVAKSIDDYNYHMKAAFYVDGLRYILGAPVSFVWVFVEDSYPYSINVVQADEQTIGFGRYEYEKVLKMYSDCLEKDHWPGCSWSHAQNRDAIKVGGLPMYARRRYQHLLEGDC